MRSHGNGEPQPGVAALCNLDNVRLSVHLHAKFWCLLAFGLFGIPAVVRSKLIDQQKMRSLDDFPWLI